MISLTTGVHVSMNGAIIRNHGYLVIDDIGSTDDTALLCNTDRPPYGVGDSTGLHQMGPEWATGIIIMFQDL